MAMKKFYVGVKGIVRDDRGYLLVKKTGRDVWESPGGRIDGDENFEQTLRRELVEELPGIEVKSIGELQGTHRLQGDIEHDTGLVLLYYLVGAALPLEVVMSDEHESYIWVNSLEDLPRTGLNSENRRILQELMTKK